MPRLSVLPYRIWLLMVFLLAWGISLIEPTDARDQWLEHTPTVALLTFLLVLDRRRPLSNTSYTLLLVFLLLHVVGAHYLYSRVPYDDWSRRWLGISITGTFRLERNHYDRVVHLMFGVLVTYPMRELVQRFFAVGYAGSLVIAVAFLAVLSKVYELAELGVAVLADPEAAAKYNGQQGDPFDAQKDMALALIGSIIVALGMAAWRRFAPQSGVAGSKR